MLVFTKGKLCLTKGILVMFYSEMTGIYLKKMPGLLGSNSKEQCFEDQVVVGYQWHSSD